MPISENERPQNTPRKYKGESRSQLDLLKKLNILARLAIGGEDTGATLNDMIAIICDNLHEEFKVRLVSEREIITEPEYFWRENGTFYPFTIIDNWYHGIFIESSNPDRKLTDTELEFISTAVKLIEIAIQKKDWQKEREKAIHTQRASEEKYKELFESSNESIRKAKQEKELILSSISELVFYHDSNLQIKWANTVAAQFCGLSIDKMVGKKCYEIWLGRSKPCCGCPVLETLKTGKKQRQEITSPKGLIWSIQAYPANDQEGNVIGVVVIARDVTRNKQIEKEMLRLDRLNLIGEMAASFGHEIRNPMSTVRGFLQMLSGKNECSTFKEYFALMIEELDRANSIISEFLSLAKDKAIELKPYNINSIIESLYPLVLADAIYQDKSIELKLEDVPQLLVDRKEIHQLILNLVRNGLDSMSAGGVLIISTHMEGEEVILEVKDEGKGIDPSILSKLGNPFVTTKENGIGLGLAVCYSIAERHAARIEIDTGPGGTTFFVRFRIPCVF